MIQTLALTLSIVLLVPGVFMALVPMLPALSYMFVVALVFAIYNSFSTLEVKELLILLGITFVSIVVDHTSGLLGAKYGGAHTKSLLWGIVGSIIGTFIAPAVGTFIGLFLGVLVAEFYYRKSGDKAIKAAGSALLGSLVGVVANVILAIAFIATFVIFVI
jgi:uncharacterized protein